MRWRYGAIAGAFLVLLSLYPQAVLIYQRGSEYKGAAFFFDYDEPAYAAYLQAIIDGRPRKNHIYAGEKEQPGRETILSVQSIPAYAAALPAWLFGFTAETCFLILAPLCAFAAAIGLFWFLSKV